MPSFPPTLAKYFWISFTIFRVLIMGLRGCIRTCWVFASFPPQQILSPTHLWYQYPFHHHCKMTLSKTATRPIPSTTFFYSGTSEKPWDLTWLVCGEPKDRSSNSFCVQHTRRHHMDGSMHAHTMNANTNNCLKEDKVFLQLNWNPRLQSQLPLTHSSNPPLLQLPFVSTQNLSCL